MRKKLHSVGNISSPMKVFRQGKDLKPGNVVIREKIPLNLGDVGESLQ